MTNYELRRRQGALLVARKLLSMAALIELIPVAIILIAPFFHVYWTMPTKIYLLFNAVTSALAIVGFAMVCRQLNLYEEALQNSSLPDLARSTRLLGIGKIVVGVQLFFYCSFLIPLINLPAILWGRSRAGSAVRALDELLEGQRRRMAMRPTPTVF